MRWSRRSERSRRPPPLRRVRTAASSNAARRRSSTPRPATTIHHGEHGGHEAKTCRPRAASSLLADLLLCCLDFPVDLDLVDRVAVAAERAVPGGNRRVVAGQLEEDFAVVILDDRVGRQLFGRAPQIGFREIELVGLVVRPAWTIEV